MTKFRLTPALAAERITLLRGIMEIVSPAPLPVPVCRDPDDDVVLAAAAAGACKCIITGDKDLLVLGTYLGIDILPPGGFSAYEAES